ncbi:hypothetical protein VKT23_006454 [Stygiomarasmius scandens]|uniref:Uncharacterized protein n=1 Tax=Marasmiellus scandens TaxID=2682957 RepID=A0ABR1JP69_9AGAR
MPSSSPSDPPPSYSSKDNNDHHHRRRHHHHHHHNSTNDTGSNDATSGDNHKHSSSSHSPNKDKKHDLSQDELLELARRGMPRSKFGPEFLKNLGKEAAELQGLPKFRVVTGSEAAKLYKEAIGGHGEDHRERDSLRRESHDRDHPHRSGSGSTSRHGISYNHNHNPVVFAFPGREAGSKVVDYYMTWKGKTRTHRLKGRRRRGDMLDEEFKKFIEGADKEYLRDQEEQEKRQSKLLSPDSALALGVRESIPSVERKASRRDRKDRSRSKSRTRPEPTTSHSAPSVLQAQAQGEVPAVLRVGEGDQQPFAPAPASVAVTVTPTDYAEEGEETDTLHPLTPLPLPTRPLLTNRESSSSVTSLPYLGMIRGVPLGNRMPLRVMNPDAASSSDSRRASVASAAFAKYSENPIHVPATKKSSSLPLPTVRQPNADAHGRDVHAHSEGEGEDGKSVLTSLISRGKEFAKRSKSRSSKHHHHSDENGSSPGYDSRSLSGSSSSSQGHSHSHGHGDKEILIVLMDEKDPNLRDAKPPELTPEEVKLLRKSSTKPPTRSVSTRGSPWDGPAASRAGMPLVSSSSTTLVSTEGMGALLEARGSTKSLGHGKHGHGHGHGRKHKHSPSRSPYSHPHSSHSSYSSLLGDDESDWESDFTGSDYDDDDYDDDDSRSGGHGLSLRAALETLRYHAKGYMKTPSPRRTPSSGGYIGLPHPQMTPIVANPGTTIVIPNPSAAAASPYVAPGVAQLAASQHASPYVNTNAIQLQATSPAGSYGAAVLYGSPYVSRSAPNLPQVQASHTPLSQAAQQLAPGQSPYVTPYVSLSQPNQQGSMPIYTPASGMTQALPLPLASTYASPYVMQAQAPLPPLGAPIGGSGSAYMGPSPYATPASRPPMPLYGAGSVHGTPYSTGTGKQLY